MKINTNIPAMKVIKQLNVTDNALTKSLERLSSGKKINRSSDNAAGLAISRKMQVQIDALDIAKRNANDGISLIQSAEGALNEVHNILQRARELAVEAANGTLSVDDANAVQAEIDSLSAEIERISSSVDYNGMVLLDGSINVKSYVKSASEDIAKVISLGDGVDNGKYTFRVEEAATKTTGIGIKASLFENGLSKYSGNISICGNSISIKEGDNAQKVFEKIRAAAQTVDVNVTCTTENFANGSKLIFENKEYGDNKIEITGDTKLIGALGIGGIDFESTSVYRNEWSTTDVSDSNEKVYINGVGINFEVGDTVEIIAKKINEVEIPGASFTYDEVNDKIIVDSISPLSIVPKNESSTNVLLSDMKSDLVKTYTTSMDIGADLHSTSNEILLFNGIDVEVEIGDTVGDLYNKLNGRIPGASFTLVGTELRVTSEQPLIIKHRNNSERLDIHGTLTNNTAIDNIITNLTGTAPDVLLAGDTSATISGCKGRSAKIEAMQFDDLATPEVEGFPQGTTAVCDGKYIKFSANGNFEIKLENNGKVGDVDLYILKAGELDLQIGANEGQTMNIRIPNMSLNALEIENINVKVQSFAEKAITKFENAIQKVSEVRSKLGAFQNRLEHTVNSLESSSESLTASLSRIVDTDMAEEIANYTQLNVLSQASMSILAQANQRPEAILQLINK